MYSCTTANAMYASPLQELATYDRLHQLPVGQTASLDLAFDYLSLSLVGSDGARFAEAGDWTLQLDDASVTIRVE